VKRISQHDIFEAFEQVSIQLISPASEENKEITTMFHSTRELKVSIQLISPASEEKLSLPLKSVILGRSFHSTNFSSK